MPVVRVETNGCVATIVVDNPPVNAMSHAVRRGVTDALSAVSARDDISAVVLACDGRTFFAGADISEFGKPPAAPSLSDVIAAIEACPKPVVAAIHGRALGGGLEIALACDARIARRDAMAGLPETTLGIIPGAGGTQRLPRLAGVKAALDMIVAGKPIGADAALALGLFDSLTDDDARASAIAFVTTHAPLAKRRIRDLPAPAADTEAVESAKTFAHARLRGQTAPLRAIEAVQAACELPFDAGLAHERALFADLVGSAQSRALRHMFFAERAAGKTGADAAPRPVVRVGVVGAGTMGAGIAIALSAAGYDAVLMDASAGALESGMQRIRTHFEREASKGRLSADEARRRTQRVTPAGAYSVLADADLVIEAVFEELAVKKEVFRALDEVAKADAILATNTSYLNVAEIGRATRCPQNVLGMHFFSPAHIMKLVEVVRTADTSPEALATALAVARKLSKIPVVAGNCRGFIGNRMMHCYQREAGLLALEGAPPAFIDRTLKEFGMPMGPFEMADLAGLDVGYRYRKSLSPEEFEPRAFRVLDLLVEMGRKGQKTGAGVYRYAPGARTPQPDPATAQVIGETAVELGMLQRDITSDEIVDRCILALVNEGARVLGDGIAARGGDIDVVLVNGYGFPRWRGGPMNYADERGLAAILQQTNTYDRTLDSRWWTPAPLLAALAAGKGRISEYVAS